MFPLLKKTLPFLFCLSVVFCNSQNKKIDSLLILLQKDKEDTVKVNHLSKLAFELRNSDPAKAIEVGNEAIILCEKFNFQKGKAEVNTWLGTANGNLGKTNEALSHFKIGLETAVSIKYHSVEARALIGRGLVYNSLGSFGEALSSYNEALKILETLDDKKFLASAYNNIGNVYNSQGNYIPALQNHLTALKLRSQVNDISGQAGSYNNIGNVYENLGNYSKALTNYEKAVKLNIETGNKNWLANNYGNMAVIYYNIAIAPNFTIQPGSSLKTREDFYAQAIKNNFQALEVKKETADKNFTGSIYNNIALIELAQGKSAMLAGNKVLANQKLNDALKNYQMVLGIREETGDKDGLAKALSNMALVYTALKNYDESRKFLTSSLEVSRETGDKEQLQAVYGGLSMLDSALGNYKGAYLNYRIYTKYRDSLSNEENTRKTVQAQMNYDFEVKQAADSLKNLAKETGERLKHQDEIQRQKLYAYGGGFGFLLMIIVAAISFKAYKQKHKANAIITQQKLQVEQKQKEILDSVRYAKRIQISLMPSEKYIERKLTVLNKKDKER